MQEFELVRQGGKFKLNNVSDQSTATNPEPEPAATSEEDLCRQAMSDWTVANLQPYEQATIQDFGWNNPGQTSASATLLVTGGDTSTGTLAITAVKLPSGEWSVS